MFVRQKLRYLLNDSFERSIDSEISTEHGETVLTQSLPHSTVSNATTVTTPSTTTQDVSKERDTTFSPDSSSLELYTHSRDPSFSAVESSSSPGQPRDTRDTSLSPIETLATGNSLEKSGEERKTPQKDGRKKTRKMNRSKSVTGSGAYRHKWRWKKAVALTSNSHNTSTTASTTTSENPQSSLSNSNPFHLLQMYKERSGECVSTNSTTTNRTDLRAILSHLDSNSETRNYELSFEREP